MTFSRISKTGVIIAIISIIAFSSISFSRGHAQEGPFFSYERFLLNQSFIDRLLGGGKTQNDLKEFSFSFTKGVMALSNGDLDTAENALLKAKKIWPEYFGTYFLLALIYEGRGEYQKAARYYKTYLDRLKKLQEGYYRISAPIIYSLSVYRVEEYPEAYELVKQRLTGLGIDIDNVRPVVVIPRSLMFLAGLVILAAIVLAGHYKVMPYLRLRYRVKHPPEGFWVCPGCGNENPDPNKECAECRRPRD